MDTNKLPSKKLTDLSEWSIFFAHVFIVFFAFTGMIWNFISELIKKIMDLPILKISLTNQWHKTVKMFGDILLKSKHFNSRQN